MGRIISILGAAATLHQAFLSLAIFVGPAAAAPTTIVNNGPPSNRVDIVFLGDGYTQANLNAGLYDQHINAYLNHMFAAPSFLADPFPRYQKFFNVHKIDVVSNQSGADIPAQSIFRDTALDAAYTSTGFDDRLLVVSNSKANAQRNLHLAGTGITADMQLVTVNHEKYGGSGGTYAVFAGGNGSAREVALHELAHSFSNLADEYVSYSTPYPGSEPSARNVTKNATGQKWSHWLGFDDPRGSNLDIGVYEGALFYPTGIYRPSLDSKMRNLNRAFDAVSREAFIRDIYQHVDPLDGWLANGATVTDAELWVDVVDPAVIAVEWYVDNVLVPGAAGSQFDAAAYGFGPGTYQVRARAYDEVLDYAFSGGLLDLVRTGLASLEQSVTWTLSLSAPMPGDYNGDEVVNALDYADWNAGFASASSLAADGNADGVVDAADYVIWRHYSSEGAGQFSELAVPEVTSSGLTIHALILLATRFRS